MEERILCRFGGLCQVTVELEWFRQINGQGEDELSPVSDLDE